MKKLPPIQKILEAYTAIVDNHVNLTENEAKVTSSNGAKTYTVSWENDVYHSNDNATYWQLMPATVIKSYSLIDI